jgi:hypothetical protein
MSRHQVRAKQMRGNKPGGTDDHKHDAEKFAHSFSHYFPPIKKPEGATLLSKTQKFAVQNRGVIKDARIVHQTGKVITRVLWKKHRSRII